jgi:hypothetical protein
MSTRRDFRAMTREVVSAAPDAALMRFQLHSQLHSKLLGGLLLLIAP